MTLLNRKSDKAVTKRLLMNHMVYQVPGKETFKLTERGVELMGRMFGPPTGESGEYEMMCINRLELVLDEGENRGFIKEGRRND